MAVKCRLAARFLPCELAASSPIGAPCTAFMLLTTVGTPPFGGFSGSFLPDTAHFLNLTVLDWVWMKDGILPR